MLRTLNIVDMLTIIGYFAIMIAIGFFSLSKRKNPSEFYVGGRNAGTFAVGCLWMSSWIGGATVIGSVDQAYNIGVSAVWYCLSMAIGCLIFAFSSARIIQRLGTKFACITYPELLEKRYGMQASVIATITTFCAYVAYTAGQFLAMGAILEYVFHLDKTSAIWLACATTVIYTAIGGFFAVTLTSVVQALITLASLALILGPFLLFRAGGLDPIVDALPASFLRLDAWGVGKITGMCVSIILTFYTAMDSYTRCFAARDAKTSQRGAFLAAFMVLVMALSTCFIGLAAKYLLPDQPVGDSVISTLIFTMLPEGLRGFTIIGLLSAIMSTGSACLLVASANLTYDIYYRYVSPLAHPRKLVMLGSFASLLVGVLACYLSIAKQNIIDVLYIAFTINSAGLFIPTIMALFTDLGNTKTAVASMGLSLITVLGWYAGAAWLPDVALFSIEPVWPGLLVSALAFAVGVLLSPSDFRSSGKTLRLHKESPEKP